MRTLNLIAVFGALALVGAGAATALNTYGTMSGTADLKPAVKLMEVQYNPSSDETGEYIVVINKADTSVDLKDWVIRDSDSSDTLKQFNSTYDTALQTGEKAYITEAEGDSDVKVPHGTPRLSTGDSSIGSGLSNSGETLELEHPDSVIISSVDYSDASCNEDQSYQRDSYDASWECKQATIGGGSQ